MSLRTQLLYPLLIVIGGVIVAVAFGFAPDTESQGYTLLTYALLAIGLYGSVVSIDRGVLRENRRIVLQAVTAGVLLKAAIIGGVVYLVLRDNIAFLLGLAVAQIDPLSVAAILHKQNRISERARTILAAWSSFDDPMTVILSVYLLVLLAPGADAVVPLEAFLVSFAANLVFAACAYLLHRMIHDVRWRYVLLIACFAVAIWFQLMLGIAIIGLFLRPPIKVLPKIVTGSFYLALFLLGLILAHGISIEVGLVVAVGAVLAQGIAAFLLTTKLPTQDRLYLAFAQQNGITAIILALLFETERPGIVAIIAPAILGINLIHYVTNTLIERQSIRSARL